jgi:GDP-4-dehydro-6-deoxy-D-mannose reductase
MKVLVTGADGFVGSLLIRRLLDEGYDVVGGLRRDDLSEAEQIRRKSLHDVRRIELELLDDASVREAIFEGWDAVVHLAAVSSGGDAQRDPVAAWRVNAMGSARLVYSMGESKGAGEDPLLLLVSTAEVYGSGPPVPRVEADPVRPVSPYAASKLAAEIAGLEVHRRTELRVVIARPFPHIGRGQDTRFVVPAFLERLRWAKQNGAPVVKVGRMDPVREFMHVNDVVSAYITLLGRCTPGEVYNVASGRAVSVEQVFFMLADAIGHRAIPEVDPQLTRPVDIEHLVGDSAKLRSETGWEPTVTLERTLEEIVNAETH